MGWSIRLGQVTGPERSEKKRYWAGIYRNPLAHWIAMPLGRVLHEIVKGRMTKIEEMIDREETNMV